MSDVGLKAPAPDQFLGDGLYVSFDGWQYRVYATNGICTTNEVFLEPSVLRAFENYVTRVRGNRDASV